MKKNEKMISCLILLATYNGQEFILEQLNSILNQKNINVTVYLSDDCSTDDTMKIVKAMDDPRVIILPIGRKFGSASKNFFRLILDVDFSNYDYIAFSDQDDIWLDNKLESTIHSIKDNNIDGCSSNVLAFWEDGNKILIDKTGKEKKFDHLFSSAGPGCTYVVTNELLIDFKAELKKKNNLSNSIELHDWLIYCFARTNGYKWKVLETVTMYYRQHDNNEFGANKGILTYLSRWKKARNGWYRNQIIKTAEFCNIDNMVIDKLNENSYFDRLKLVKMVFDFRKKKKEALFLAICLIIPGFK